MTSFQYIGEELDLFAKATTWKRYLRTQLTPYIRGRVLEVGAGIGASTKHLAVNEVESWVCLEPDASLAACLVKELHSWSSAARYEVVVGTVESYGRADFDCILYIDVLEHIRDDREEVERAASRLRDGGHLVVISPAHPWLFTPFDEAIGHYRRYTRKSLRALTPPGLQLARLDYLDAVGLLASAGNRLLRSSMPTQRQIQLWDRIMVPLSRAVDRFTGFNCGKSILAVWTRES